jgi:hypothetical protein
MVQTADLVYLHLVDHDPQDGSGFPIREQQVWFIIKSPSNLNPKSSYLTKGLESIKDKDSVSQFFVSIAEWPSFPIIEKVAES